GSRQGVRGRRQGRGRRKADRLEAEGVQVRLRRVGQARSHRDHGPADRRPDPVSAETDQRRRPIHRGDGTATAFVTTKEDPDINQPTIDYVRTYVSDGTGKKFIPHVTVGVAPPEYVKKMLGEKFEAFTFSPVEV